MIGSGLVEASTMKIHRVGAKSMHIRFSRTVPAWHKQSLFNALFCSLTLFVGLCIGYSSAQDVPPPKPKPASPNTSTKPASTQQSAYGILVKVDIDSMVSVDGADPVLVHAGKARRFKGSLGDHLVQATSLDGQTADEKSVDQQKPQVLVEISLTAVLEGRAEQQRQAQAQQEQVQRQQEAQQHELQVQQENQRRRTQAIQDKLNGLVGRWTRSSSVDGADLTDELNLREVNGNSLSGTCSYSIVARSTKYRSLNVYYSVLVTLKSAEAENIEISYKYLQCTGFCDKVAKEDEAGSLRIRSRAEIYLHDGGPFGDKTFHRE
jgi:hypothetical protein